MSTEAVEPVPTTDEAPRKVARPSAEECMFAFMEGVIKASQGFVITVCILFTAGLFLCSVSKGSLQGSVSSAFSSTISQLNRLNEQGKH